MPDPVATPAGADRPPAVHLQARFLALVAAGGVLGTAAREALTLAVPDPAGFPLAILVINVTGAFALGLLLEALVRGGPDVGRRRAVRLVAGTGFCGGFTTYSTLTVGASALVDRGAGVLSLGYLLATLLVGAAASWAGVAVGAAAARRRAGA